LHPSDPPSKRYVKHLGNNFSRDPRAVQAPRAPSFLEFLEHHARVPSSDLRRAGEFEPYTFIGREALREPCRVLDLILGSSPSPPSGERAGVRGRPANPLVPSSELGVCGEAKDEQASESLESTALEDARPTNPEPGTRNPEPLKDATLVLAGGAQFGKTILELYLAAFITSQRFLNLGVYLPDDGLADAIVDTKFRPVVMDNLPWFAEMAQIGKAVNKSGKAVHTKGAFLVTDGQRTAVGMFRGLKRIPTSFSLDVVVRDEEDDIPRDKAKYLSGRLTASALRLQIIIGTQRVAGAGQNKQWEQGSQGVMMIGPVSSEFRVPSSELFGEASVVATGGASVLASRRHTRRGRRLVSSLAPPQQLGTIETIPPGWLCPEEHWPQICRLQLGERPSPDDPQLGWEGDFRRDGTPIAEHTPDARYYLAHPETGQPLDRSRVLWLHRRPEKIKLRHWSFRISQLGCAAIDLAQIVAHWTRAVADSQEMTSFCCDRLARPKSTGQSLTPQILQRSRDIEPFDFGIVAASRESAALCPRWGEAPEEPASAKVASTAREDARPTGQTGSPIRGEGPGETSPNLTSRLEPLNRGGDALPRVQADQQVGPTPRRDALPGVQADQQVGPTRGRDALPRMQADQQVGPTGVHGEGVVGAGDTAAHTLQRFNDSTIQRMRFAGLDTGDRCWFFLREAENCAVKRCARVDPIALGDVVNRVRALCQAERVDCLFIDERPAVSEARTLALLLNGLENLDHWPRVDWLDRQCYVSLPGGLTWDGRSRRWLNLRCALVRFSRKTLGAGIEQTGAEFTEGAQTKFVPLIQCNRFETIDRAVREFLTPAENVIEVVDFGGSRHVRQEPSMRLPRRAPGAPGVLEALDAHLLTGSQRSKDEQSGELGDYVDGCENHLLLADAYSALAESVCGGNRHSGGAITDVRGWRMGSNKSDFSGFTPSAP